MPTSMKQQNKNTENNRNKKGHHVMVLLGFLKFFESIENKNKSWEGETLHKVAKVFSLIEIMKCIIRHHLFTFVKLPMQNRSYQMKDDLNFVSNSECKVCFKKVVY